ncbi:PilZ domain-containing protein [Teredinibacter turnerae]|uniref:PilZ domain-containing protein n=1 Tax=Teredinibacter turnerae TaxID=2426 RepID=UPI000377593F|nr:PilZ domain-containing protein [Teredinibacter turnerae]
MSDNQERRRFTRVEFSNPAKMIQGEAQCSAVLLDISLNGVLLKTPDEYRINVEEPLEIRIELAQDTEIQMKGSLAHSSNTMLGFRCDSIDVDSVAHLRRLLELNMGETDAAERVLAELLHLA